MSRRISAAIVAFAVAAGALLLGTPAYAAAGDQVSATFSTPGDFGSVPTGSTKRLVLTLENDGTDIVTIDPTPVMALSAPFTYVSTTITAGETIVPLATRTVTVDYTAGAVGTTPTDTITLTAVSTADPTVSAPVILALRGASIAAGSASFAIADPVDGAIDLGDVQPGSTSSLAITVINDGTLDLEFDPTGLVATSTEGASLPVAYEGDAASRSVRPGETVTLHLTLGPVPTGTASGVLTLRADYSEDGKVIASAARSLSFVGRLVAPSPTANPLVPASADSTGRQLASTGADGVGGFVGGTVAVMVLLAGVAAVAQRRAGKRA
ncbi:choice-of-anchor D domain-containing protein [Cnuibacter sp. UC19_7]|uniref:choice-of-anchor D domain-containing protein n=1 Tax=Cnuibacter sp. UC19_7 TaxID=3350166 RepID=UPI00366FC904